LRFTRGPLDTPSLREGTRGPIVRSLKEKGGGEIAKQFYLPLFQIVMIGRSPSDSPKVNCIEGLLPKFPFLPIFTLNIPNE
jgi:hypothetical protein